VPTEVHLIQHGPEGVEDRNEKEQAEKDSMQPRVQPLRDAKRAAPHPVIEPQAARRLEDKLT
jgi:hypothetical protein